MSVCRWLSVSEFAKLTGIPATTVRDRCERHVYRTRRGHAPGQHWQLLAVELRRELRKQGR